MARDTLLQANVRLRKAEVVRTHYSEFIPFLHEVMELLGFSVSEIQEDIARFLAYGPHYLMIQAQRGQAKTSIAAAYCVWCLIQDPSYRILIISAGGSQASDISTLIIRIIMNMPVLEYLRPDVQNGDRSSVEHFDVHYTLKGVDKSPSVKCMGITANLQGNRADLILADDVESQKNSYTATMRLQLLEKTLDFSSICSTGRIVWLGTPQSMESIYNTLPGRGFTIRIWPGRYPTAAQMQNYGEALAPLLQRRLKAEPSLATGGGFLGDQGKPIEKEGTGWLDEANLQKKERDQGTSWFQLQHMLNTRLVDALRFPLKPTALVCMMLAGAERLPLSVVRGMDASFLQGFNVNSFGFSMTRPLSVSVETDVQPVVVAYIDPAGGGLNADETAYAVTTYLHGTVYLRGIGGLPGGYELPVLEELAERMVKAKVTMVLIEKNMGFGAFREVFTPVLKRAFDAAKLPHPGIDDDMVTGQKEKRIIATLEPVMGRGALVVCQSVVEQDQADCERYAPKDRLTYSLFYQIAKLTKERGSLKHDDRVDALEGAVRYWQARLEADQDKALAAAKTQAFLEMQKNPLGREDYNYRTATRNTLSKYRR